MRNGILNIETPGKLLRGKIVNVFEINIRLLFFSLHAVYFRYNCIINTNIDFLDDPVVT